MRKKHRQCHIVPPRVTPVDSRTYPRVELMQFMETDTDRSIVAV